jgi:hypothetical protein
MRTAVQHVLASVALPADATPSPSPSTGPNPDLVSPGLLGFVSFLFLIVAVYFIGRGLTKQLKRVDFDEDKATADMLGEPEPTEVPDGTPEGGVDLGTPAPTDGDTPPA